MQKTWKPISAGILTIIAGVIALSSGACARGVGSSVWLFPWYFLGLMGVATFRVIIALVAIGGGICALSRKVWGLALAGAILSIFSGAFVLGILATIFVALGKNEFA